MPEFKVGQKVRVRCEVQPGPFENEKLITLNTIHGPISGFLGAHDLESVEGEIGYVRAIVLNSTEKFVTVRLQGSFFTTNGLAELAPEEALAA
jgi:hypothetical protein